MGKTLVLDGFKLKLKPQFSSSLKDFVLRNMFLFANSFWVAVLSYIVHIFTFIFRGFLSSSGEKNSDEIEVGSDSDDVGIVENENEEVGCDEIEEIEEIPNPNLESEMGIVTNTSTSKYQFFSGNNSLCAFIEEPQTMSFTVQEVFVISNNHESPKPNKQVFLEDYYELPKNDLDGFSLGFSDVSCSGDMPVDSCESSEEEKVVVEQGKTESSVCGMNCDEHEVVSSLIKEHEIFEEGEIVNVEDEIVNYQHQVVDRFRLSVSNSDDFWASIHKYDDFSGSYHNSDHSETDERLCDKSPGNEIQLEPETPLGTGDKRVNYEHDSPRLSDECPIDDNSTMQLGGVVVVVDSEHEEEVDSQFIEIEPQLFDSTVQSEEHTPSDEFSESDHENEALDGPQGIDASESSDEDEEEEEDEEGDVLLEQKELIRQMKKEMRHLKISGLPTILEESESPRVEDDLRPLKIDERIGHKDRMDEIQTLYKRYLDKMRKLDILSQQTMYAIGLLQLKNQDQFASNKKLSVPVIKSLLAQNFWSYKFRKHEADPLQKLIRDFQTDLELVYVGQLCLSWEILKWQHHKSEELQSHDPDGFRQHNQVAGEFQKFQVLLQRFTEDEPFHHGPRVQHYVKSRCSLPNLLQVPLIKDDSRGEWRGEGEGGISIGMLKEVIGASMRAFWEFLRADKDEISAMTLIGIHGVQADLEDPSDAQMLTEIRATLQKKEKRLKDLVRSGNCIVKKFQKHQDQRLSHEMFIAQVELRLVSRALSMSKLTTDQLLWCHKKVNKINIVGRKIYLDSSFLLFPC